MAKYHYRVSGETKWQGLSGTAILALVNKVGSGKKIDINSVQIFPQTFFGASITAGTFPTTVPSMFRLIQASSLSAGNTWAGFKMDTNGSDFPTSTVQVKTRSAFVPNWIDITGSYTDATIAVNDTTFTPGSAPSWVINQFQYLGNVLYVSSGGNTGRYRIQSNTATALTIEAPGFQSTASATGTIQQIASYCNIGVIKNFSVSAVGLSQMLGYGKAGLNSANGLIWQGNKNSNLERIKVNAGEKVALVPYPIHTSMPLILELTLTLEGTPNRTFQYETFINAVTENEALFSIDNNAGSGQVVRIDKIKITEVGTFDTPYFQLVPLGQIDATSIVDTDKKLTATAFDDSAPAISSSVCEIFTNSPILPTGAIPQSYIAEGSAGTPRGYNYLNTKDFIGPTYINIFPEVTPFGGGNTYLTNWTSGTSSLTSFSMPDSVIKGKEAPIVIREGEQIGLVSGAETATAATAVPQSGWHTFYFAVNFSIEDATTLSITVLDGTGSPVQNARVYVEKVSDNSQILNSLTDVNGQVTTTYNFPGTNVSARIRVRKSSGVPKYVPYETLGTITSSGLTATCVISVDTIA